MCISHIAITKRSINFNICLTGDVKCIYFPGLARQIPKAMRFLPETMFTLVRWYRDVAPFNLSLLKMNKQVYK